MSLNEQITEALKLAMKAKDQAGLRALRAIKAELLLLKTKEGGGEISAEDELGSLVKMAKQRRDSISIFREQNREDLAVKEEEELVVIEQFLPKQMSRDELETEISKIIQEVGASSMKDMGRVMGVASGKLKGRADGKLISEVVKQLLSQ